MESHVCRNHTQPTEFQIFSEFFFVIFWLVLCLRVRDLSVERILFPTVNHRLWTYACARLAVGCWLKQVYRYVLYEGAPEKSELLLCLRLSISLPPSVVEFQKSNKEESEGVQQPASGTPSNEYTVFCIGCCRVAALVDDFAP